MEVALTKNHLRCLALCCKIIMKSKVINFDQGLSGLKHRRGAKKSAEEKNDIEEQNNVPDSNVKIPEVISESSPPSQPPRSSQNKTIKFLSKNEKIQNIVLELASLQGAILPPDAKGSFNFDLLNGTLANNPSVDRVMELIMELVDVTGYSLEELLLGGKLQDIIVNDKVLSKKFSFEESEPRKVDFDSLFDFSDDDDDDDDEIYHFDGKKRVYYINGRDIVISKPLKHFQSINVIRTRIKEIIAEIYDRFLDDPLLKQLSEDPKSFKKVNSTKKAAVNDYYRLVEELEDLSEHDAPDVFLSENLRRLAKRYRVRLKF